MHSSAGVSSCHGRDILIGHCLAGEVLVHLLHNSTAPGRSVSCNDRKPDEYFINPCQFTIIFYGAEERCLDYGWLILTTWLLIYNLWFVGLTTVG